MSNLTYFLQNIKLFLNFDLYLRFLSNFDFKMYFSQIKLFEIAKIIYLFYLNGQLVYLLKFFTRDFTFSCLFSIEMIISVKEQLLILRFEIFKHFGSTFREFEFLGLSDLNSYLRLF